MKTGDHLLSLMLDGFQLSATGLWFSGSYRFSDERKREEKEGEPDRREFPLVQPKARGKHGDVGTITWGTAWRSTLASGDK